MPRPEFNRRPRRSRGVVLVLFAVCAFALVGLCIVGIRDEAASPEGMASFAFTVVALELLAVGCGLLLGGLLLRWGRFPVGPAWLVDPVDAGTVRWWDGRAWTDHTSVRSPRTVALAPLVSSSRRRRLVGISLLFGGVLAALAMEWLGSATVVSPTEPGQPTNQLPGLAMQLVTPAACAAVFGLYLFLTLADDVRPSWQPDPLDSEQLRWWDGRDWGDDTTPKTAPEGYLDDEGAVGEIRSI